MLQATWAEAPNRSPCINMVTTLVVTRRMVVVLDKPGDVYTDWEGLGRFSSLFSHVQLNVILVGFTSAYFEIF
jgi:hypothetical protein